MGTLSRTNDTSSLWEKYKRSLNPGVSNTGGTQDAQNTSGIYANYKAGKLPTQSQAQAQGQDTYDPKSAVESDIENYQTRLNYTTGEVPEYEEETSRLVKALEFIDKPRNAIATGISYATDPWETTSGWEGAKKGLKSEDYTWGSELLEGKVEDDYLRGVLGFGLDVLLSPETYVTFGAGSLGKGALTGAGKSLSREGASTLLKSGSRESAEAVLKATGKDLSGENIVTMANRLSSQGADNVIKNEARKLTGALKGSTGSTAARAAGIGEDMVDSLAKDIRTKAEDFLIDQSKRTGGKGLSVAGKSIVPGYKMQDIGAGLSQKAKDVPYLGTAVEGTQRAGQNLFSSVPSLKGVSNETRKLIYNWSRERKGTKGALDTALMEDTINIFKNTDGKYWDEARQAIEKGAVDVSDQAAKVMTAVRKDMTKWGLEEKQLGLLDSMLEDYLPHQLSWDVKKGTYKAAGGSSTKGFKVPNKHNLPRKYQGTIDEVNEKLEEEYGVPNMLETSLTKLYMDRGLKHNKMVADKHFVDEILNGVGEPVQMSKAALKELDDDMTTVVAKTGLEYKPPGAATAKPITRDNIDSLNLDPTTKEVLKDIYKEDTGALMDATRVKELEKVGIFPRKDQAYAIPKSVADYVNGVTKLQLDEGSKLVTNAIGTIHSVWKGLVTTSTGFHTRNLLGANYNNWLDVGFKAFDPKLQKAAGEIAAAELSGGKIAGGKSIVLGGTKYTYNEIRDLMRRHNVLNTFMTTGIDDSTEYIQKEITRELSPWRSKGQYLSPVYYSRKAGNTVESQVRATNFMAHLDKGESPANAAQKTIQYQFDYSDLSDFEQKVVRSAAPFYTWFKNNLPLQLENILNQPGKYSSIYKGQQNMGEALDADMENMPSWMEGQVPIPVKTGEEGEGDEYLTMDLPYTELNAGYGDLLGMMSPLFKAPMEQYLNTNFFTGAPIEDYPGEKTGRYGIEMSERLAHTLDQFGISRQAQKMITTPATTDYTVLEPLKSPAETGMHRTYYPEGAEIRQQYDYRKQLENTVKQLRDMGYDVPTITEINQEAQDMEREKAKGGF